MIRYLVKSFIGVIPTLWGVATIVFFLIHLTPGDPALAILGPHATAESVTELRHNLGLDQPLPTQYVAFMGRLLRGDLGRSLVTEQPVLMETLRPFPYTVQLALAGIVIALLLGIPVGVISAVRRNTLLDYVVRASSISGISVPVFFLAIVFLWIFSAELGWFPMIGVGDTSSWRSLLHHIVLPATTIGISMAVLIMRLPRSSMLDVLGQDYVRTARAKGLGERAVIWGHALKNAALPVVTIITLDIPTLFSGAVVTESIFAWPGMGRLFLESAFRFDYAVLMGVVTITAGLVILSTLLADLLYAWLDPRIRLS